MALTKQEEETAYKRTTRTSGTDFPDRHGILAAQALAVATELGCI
jgi:hypothetical protein